MENKDKPAFPTENEHQSGNSIYHFEGLTKREYFTMSILIGLSSVPNTGLTVSGVCSKAIEMADELDKQLYNDSEMLFHECANCNNRCNCDGKVCICCADLPGERLNPDGSEYKTIMQDSILFAQWLCKNAIIATDKKYWIYNGENFHTERELYKKFKNS